MGRVRARRDVAASVDGMFDSDDPGHVGAVCDDVSISLRSVVTRPVLAVLFGAAGGPIAFLAGERLGAVTLLPPLAQSLLRLSMSWAIALVVFSAVVLRIAPERGGDYRHA